MIVNNAGCAVYSFVIGCVHTLHDSWKSQLYWMCYMWHHRGHNMRGRSKTDVTNLPSATAAGQQKNCVFFVGYHVVVQERRISYTF